MNRKQVQVGIIGLGQVWEQHYRPALVALRDRIKVAAVNDCIPARANLVASEFGISAIHGVSTLANHAHLQALLLLESDWRGTGLLPMLLESRMPIFVVEPLGNDLQYVDQIRRITNLNEQTIVPELSTRYTPASNRFQELLATSHGAVTEIIIKAILPLQTISSSHKEERQTHFLINQFDWCQHILQRAPSELFAKINTTEEESEFQIKLVYPATSNAANAVHATINIQAETDLNSKQNLNSKQLANGEQSNRLVYEICCEEGEVVINSETEILWKLTGEKQIHERLTSERTSREVMLDHFCRRIVGGLLPVADLDDISRSVKLVQFVEQSLNENRTIDVTEC